MEPVGLNVGSWYLTELRPEAWLTDEAYAWAVRVNTTGESIGEVTLLPNGEITVCDFAGAGDTAGADGADDGPDAEGLRTARDAVARFAASW